ncbi:hypothetical protein [Duncaniella muris]|mgnify:FL=1|uniref:hypothetical protein n=1 Tax=Duncaniella muris TaxID=2094150 RepID=UPI002675EE83|nr:hypothetical protein [Duncaniella muris]
MKATLIHLILSLLLSAGMASCTQSEENDQANEIRESIEANDRTRIADEFERNWEKRRAQIAEINQNRLSELASTPEGREIMEKSLLKWKHSYVEGDHLIFRLTRDQAIAKGFTAEEYDKIIEVYTWCNHEVDSCKAVAKAQNTNITYHHDNFIQNFEQARNGTHEYYKYLTKNHSERPDAPALRDRK